MQTAALACPVCHAPLSPSGTSLICPARHTHDISAKGYVNLLLAQDRHSPTPGDSREMVDARRRFLGQGHYRVLSDALAASIVAQAEGKKRFTLVDAGCGEGTYATAAFQALQQVCPHAAAYGFDISKDAVLQAARKNREITWAVASLFRMPLKDGCADVLLNAFAPAADAEFARILRKGGTLLCVIPGKRHLFGLKEILYENPYENDEAPPQLPSFRLTGTQRLEERLHITRDNGTQDRKGIVSSSGVAGNNGVVANNGLSDLLAMTPYFWKSPKSGIDRLNALEELDTEISFLVLSFQKV